MPTLPDLPIRDALPALQEALATHHNALLEAPPGAGKSTVVPLALLEAGWRRDGRIVMLEPRRIAARAVATRMARLLGEDPGGTVGFRTRLETRVGPHTCIEVVTEGVLTRMLQHDPALEGVACVVFDEFHERNLQGDLGLALCLDSQRHLRPDLRLLVMSATLDGEALLRLLGKAGVVRAPGRMHEVETRYAAPPRTGTANSPCIAQPVAATTVRALGEHEGDALVFLPGGAEIRSVSAALRAALPEDRFSVLPLYGDLPAALQDAALRPDPGHRRKIVVATNIAETSLTIDGVRIVVDGGFERRPRFDPSSGMSRLATTRIARASAEQRRGRAGRMAPGVCYRLWSESVQASLVPQAPAEILETDLGALALELACWGTGDPGDLRWLDPPPAATYVQARELLTRLEALDDHGRVTPLGRDMAALGLHPRLAHMVLRGHGLGQGDNACLLAAILSERDPLRAPSGFPDPDVVHRMHLLRGEIPPPGLEADRGAVARIRTVADRLQRSLRRVRPRPAGSDAAARGRPERPAAEVALADSVGLLLAYAYPDRIGRTRDAGGSRFLLSGGRGASFTDATALARSEYIVVASLDSADRDARIRLAASIDPRLIEEHFAAAIEEIERIEWDPPSEAVLARRLRRLGALTLSDDPLPNPDPGAVFAAMLQGVRSLGLGCLPWTRALEQWRARVAFVREHDPRGRDDWPDLSDEALLASLESWLGPWLGGIARRDEFRRLDLSGALHRLLDWNAARRLDELAPTHLVVPSGSRLALDYASGTPTLSVRLQEMFGLSESPRVLAGRLPVTLELLSPARRPVQVTRDLASFWARGYHEVRRDLRGRYPKHYWPEDPRDAVATRRLRPRGDG
jgi:ATP-dependent helicase HrpB